MAIATEYDEIDRFLLVVDQMAVAAELLGSEQLAKQRVAIVTVDNLASLLLHRHAKRVFAGSEGSWWLKRDRYSTRDRQKILGDFNRQLMLATKESDAPSWRAAPQLLSTSDATVMRVAHGYRNLVYHEDRHNEALLAPLTALYLQSVGQMFHATYDRGIAWSIDASRAARLEVYGYTAKRDDFGPTAMLHFAEAALIVVAGMTEGFSVDLKHLAEWLSDDIVERTVSVAHTLVELDEGGMPHERLEHVFFWSQFWAAHGADERWMRLQDARDELREDDGDGEGSPAGGPSRLSYDEADRAFIEYGHVLQEEFKPSVSWGDTVSLGEQGQRLRTAKSISSLLERYERIDRAVELLERATARAVSAWDQMVEDEVDRRRGV